jgi:GDPmannose 4,6-dehydratase
MTRKTALIFGISGQCGSFLSEILLANNYVVFGVIRRSSTTFTTNRLIPSVYEKIKENLCYGDIVDANFVTRIVNNIKPDEIYNLSAQSHVKVSFELPEYTTQVDALGLLNILESVKNLDLINSTKIFQASTSEQFGGLQSDFTVDMWKNIQNFGMNEMTPMYPKSPYGAAKLYAYNLVKIYRKSYNMRVMSAILFNNESERRDPRFVTRKITQYAHNLRKNGYSHALQLGNIYAIRDWGYSKDYMNAVFLMMQHHTPIDFVIASGNTFNVKEFIECSFKYINIDFKWEGTGKNEKCIDKKTGNILIEINEKYYRPNEVEFLKGDPSLIKSVLNWNETLTFPQLVAHMIDNEN